MYVAPVEAPPYSVARVTVRRVPGGDDEDRVAVVVLPFLAAWLALRVARELKRSEHHPLRGSSPPVGSGTE